MMYLVLSCLVAAATILQNTVFAINPGFRTVVSSKGLDYLDQVGTPILEQQLASIDIPDVSGSADIGIGKIDYSLSSIHLANLKIPSSSITSGASGLAVKASGISISGSAHWHYREHSWPHISDSGSADLSVSSVSLQVSVLVGKDANGHPTLKTTGCSLSIGGLSIKFHGGASWLYNLFDSYIEDAVKSSMQSQICTAATGAINDQGNKALESLPIVVEIDKNAEVNYELIADPTFTTTYIETQHKGEFFYIPKPVEAPLSPVALPAVATDRMMYLWMTQYIANTAGIVYLEAGVLQYTVTPDVVPSGFPLKLNTASFKLIVPALYSKYPDMPMELYLNATEPPVLQVSKGANFTVKGTVDVNVVQKNKTLTKAFTLGLTVYADVRLWVNQTANTQATVDGNCTLLKFDVSVVSSAIGKVSVDGLNQAIEFLINLVILPLINNYANKGLIIPTVDGFSFINPQLVFGEGYIMIATDINYKPSFIRSVPKMMNNIL